MAKKYRGPSKPIEIYRKRPAEIQKRKSPEALSLMQQMQQKRIGDFARLQAKIDALNKLIIARRPSKAASILRYWIKYHDNTKK